MTTDAMPSCYADEKVRDTRHAQACGAWALQMTEAGHPPPCVSVIITVFRRTEFLADAIRSVLRQDFSDFEIIVSDDSNSNQIRQIVAGFDDTRVRYNPSVPRKGVARNVDDSIKLARGQYVAILNDDDTWESNFLSELVGPLLAGPSRVLAFSDHWIMDQDGTLNPERTEQNSRYWGRLDLPAGDLDKPAATVVVSKAVPLVMGALFRRDALSPAVFDDAVGGAYDYWLACALAATGRPLYYTPLRLTRYRVHDQMETQRRDPLKGEDELLILTKIRAAGWFGEITGALDARFAQVAFGAALNKLRFGLRREARGLAVAGLRKSFRLKGLVIYLASFAPTRLFTRS